MSQDTTFYSLLGAIVSFIIIGISILIFIIVFNDHKKVLFKQVPQQIIAPQKIVTVQQPIPLPAGVNGAGTNNRKQTPINPMSNLPIVASPLSN